MITLTTAITKWTNTQRLIVIPSSAFVSILVNYNKFVLANFVAISKKAKVKAIINYSVPTSLTNTIIASII